MTEAATRLDPMQETAPQMFTCETEDPPYLSSGASVCVIFLGRMCQMTHRLQAPGVPIVVPVHQRSTRCVPASCSPQPPSARPPARA